MRLDIKNFAKIKTADIIVDGITVIAGENNTGKSTVGKILFSIFNSLSNVEEKIFKERLSEIENTNRLIIRDYISGAEITRIMLSRRVYDITRKIVSQIRNKAEEGSGISDEILFDIVDSSVRTWQKTAEADGLDDLSNMVADICANTREILNLPEEEIVLEVVSRYFERVFHSQIRSLAAEDNEEAELLLEIKGKTVRLLFKDNACKELEDNIKIIHKAIYIDNPFIIDQLLENSYAIMNPMNRLLIDMLTDDAQTSVMDGVIETVRVKEKLSDIYKTLENIVDGDILINQKNGEYYLKNRDFEEPISFQNLSAGLKAFVILKLLLEKGCLKEKDVLVLDEPEIHLHPQWQIAYAELIVLLQKHFDLSVIVTTHSQYFVDAINLFSCKYKTDKAVHYYVSSNVGNTVTMECVTGNIDKIYKKMATPIQLLDTLRYELNNL